MKKPTVNQLIVEIIEYAVPLGYKFGGDDAAMLAEEFLLYYNQCGWKVGRKNMVSWQHGIKRWVRNNWKKPRVIPKNTFRERKLKEIEDKR